MREMRLEGKVVITQLKLAPTVGGIVRRDLYNININK